MPCFVGQNGVYILGLVKRVGWPLKRGHFPYKKEGGCLGKGKDNGGMKGEKGKLGKWGC